MVEDGDPSNPDRKTFVLCFDGTGNKFEGKATDSNILKIYRLLDRTQRNQYSWYNPGIGTYVQTSSLEHTSAYDKIKSWYTKTKDEAVGSSLGDHVMAGYKFLMRYYSAEDDIYIFGFSRGAYTARFLAEMLDHVGLLSAGNEELQRFAWKCFSKWQARPGGNGKEEKKKTQELYEYMKAFRETFSRPVRRIRFLGLFDTVNSVPRFESAWMSRSKFPYTARSSAKVIRHAVSINERRAKFRVDLVSGSRPDDDVEANRRNFHRYQTDLPSLVVPTEDDESKSRTHHRPHGHLNLPHLGSSGEEIEPKSARQQTPLLSTRPTLGRGASYTEPYVTPSTEDLRSNMPSHERNMQRRRFSDLRRAQDVLEVWFAGGHGDIGGGWQKHSSETWPLSHSPLVWMVHEAEKAGLKFDPEKLAALNCCPDKIDEYGNRDADHAKLFHDALHSSSVQGFLHDCLRFGGGLKWPSVLTWKMMEYAPFTRMDLQPDGSWKPIRFPLPRGEVRDIPADAKIHGSVIRRMKGDENFRPGNLIEIGTGGRGRKTAKKADGMGDFVCIMNEDDPVHEIWASRKWVDGEVIRKGRRIDSEKTVNGNEH